MQQLKNKDACCLVGERERELVKCLNVGNVPGMNGRIGMRTEPQPKYRYVGMR